MVKKSLAVACGIVTLASCTPKTTTQPIAAKKITPESLAQGKTLFENSCNRCHALPDPKKYSDKQWIGLVNAMAPKAKLTNAQGELIYDYVTSRN